MKCAGSFAPAVARNGCAASGIFFGWPWPDQALDLGQGMGKFRKAFADSEVLQATF